MYPVLIPSLGTAVGVVTVVLRTVIHHVRDEFGALEKALKGILTISTVLMSPLVVVLPWTCSPDRFNMSETIARVRGCGILPRRSCSYSCQASSVDS